MVRILTKHGAPVNSGMRFGWTPLMLAFWHPGVTTVLLAAGADPNQANEDGHTPLMQAAGEYTATEVVRLLLASGANVNAQDNAGWTALMRTVSADHVKAAKLLLAAGADVGIRTEDGKIVLDLIREAIAWASRQRSPNRVEFYGIAKLRELERMVS